jgi:alpha-D-ribose 1-methylphosphonate 5-triphosphate diphosphatase PhnM
MAKARKYRRGKDHLSKKQAERWFKRLLAAEIEKEEKSSREELRLNSKSSKISFSSSNPAIPEHWRAIQPKEPHPFLS